MSKDCKDFILAYGSKTVTCFSCRWWHMQDFACLNPDELAKRRKENEFDSTDRIMRNNRAISGPL